MMKNFSGLSFGWMWKRLEEKCLNDARARGRRFGFTRLALDALKVFFFSYFYVSPYGHKLGLSLHYKVKFFAKLC
jgi:hypothetical protein